jgi:hypothetical protein
MKMRELIGKKVLILKADSYEGIRIRSISTGAEYQVEPLTDGEEVRARRRFFHEDAGAE